jgi:hypothetical protein
MKADDITSVQVVEKDQGGDGYGVSIDNSSKIVLNINNGARATSATAVAAGKWYHIACRYTQVHAEVYINGSCDISSAYATDAADAATDLTIGAKGDGTNDWDGHLKDLAMWSVALTPLQIKSLALGVDLSSYSYRPSNTSTTPTAWWKCNESAGTRANMYPSGLSNASIDDEDMADITDWSDGDAINGESTQATFDGKSCMKLDSGAATAGTYARRSQDIGSVGASTVYSMNIYFDAIGTIANSDNAWFIANDGTHRLSVWFASNGLYVTNSSSVITAIGTNPIVQDVWQEWTFKVTWGASATVDIYLNGALFAAGVDCAEDNAEANGTIYFFQLGNTTSNRITYIDWFKAGSGFTNDLLDNGTVPAEGGYIEGVAPHLDGSADYFSCPDLTDFDLSGGVWSFSAWIKADTVSGDDIIYQQSTDANNKMEIRLESGKVNISVVAASSEVVNVVGATTLIVNTWYHIACTEDGDTWKIYVDGKDNTASGGSDAQRAANYSGDVRIGTNSAGANDFDGFICDVALWKGTAISAAEVASLAAGLTIQQAGVVSYWKMNDASGNATDSIGANTLTQTGGTIATASGIVATARDFERNDAAYFRLTNNDAVDIVLDMSICGWVKPESVGSASTILDKDLAGDGYGVQIGSANKVNFYIANDTDASTTSIAAGTWSSLAGVYDGAVKSIYFNSAIEGTGAFTTNPADTVSNLFIGATTSATNFLDGLLDEVLLVKRWFRPEEVKTIYIKGWNGKEATSSEVTPPGPVTATRRIFIIS